MRYAVRHIRLGGTCNSVTLLGGTAAAWPLSARAQQPAIPVIGLLSPESATTGNINGLHEGLRELGYVEGRDIRFEYRWAEGRYEQLPNFAAELVRLKVDVIVAFVTQAALSAKSATGTIPIVMVGVDLSPPLRAPVATSRVRPPCLLRSSENCFNYSKGSSPTPRGSLPFGIRPTRCGRHFS